MQKLLALAALASASAALNWPNKTISWWYAPDNNWPQLISQITPYTGNASSPSLVTSVQSYCGLNVNDDGTILPLFSDVCTPLFAALRTLGVRPEINLNAGNCSIDAYRTLWADLTVSPKAILTAALSANASGVNIDLEPQADNCQGGATGTAADATVFAQWLSTTRRLLNAAGIRLTVDVASWSPVLSQYKTLSSSVDRLQNMETYNGDSYDDWLTYYNAFISQVPLEVAGVGIGVWDDGNGQWWETPAGAAQKVAKCIADGVPEIALFRLDPPSMPDTFWWSAIAPYAA
jgi:hypothetical protein